MNCFGNYLQYILILTINFDIMKLLWVLGILFFMTTVTNQVSNPALPSYIAAVAEYSPVTSFKDGVHPANQNANNYLKFIKKAVEFSVDILVFPESSLSTETSKNVSISRIEAASYIPDPRDEILICNNSSYSYSLQVISCGARDHNMYVVVNHKEKVNCTAGPGCPGDGLLTYNTNVAFDRRGRLIARYRKYNLFGEIFTNRTSEPELSTFHTDFGVTFGQFICFDLLFEKPALQLVRDNGVTDVIYSTHWFSELPYLYSVEAQAGWAYANDVNFIASGYNCPKTASTGSGIYIGRNGYSNIILKSKASNVLLVSTVPKVIKGKRSSIDLQKSFKYEFNSQEISTTENNSKSPPYLHLNDDLSVYTTRPVNPTAQVVEETVCDRELCCEFKLKLKFDETAVTNETNYYRYRMTVFNGTRNYSNAGTGGIKICGLISCVNETLNSCGKLFDPSHTIFKPTTFEYIEITMRKVNDSQSFFMPTILTGSMLPVNATDYEFESLNHGNNSSTHTLRLTKPRSDLLTFAIYGRYFARDGSRATNSMTMVLPKTSIVLMAFAFIMFEWTEFLS